MKVLPIVTKPVYPTAILNSLLTAARVATHRGDPGSLDFRDQDEFENPDNAARGAFNPAYALVSRLDELDPTAELSTARRVVEDRNPSTRVGYTSTFREMMYKTAYSAIIGQWWRDFNILFRMAQEAEVRRDSVTANKRLHTNADVEDTDGYVEMFLAAVGDIDGSLMRYPIDKEVKVSDIYAQVVVRISPLISHLDHYGFQKGFDTYANAAGEGSLPGMVGEKLFVLPARTFDGLGRAPLRRVLVNPRSRDLARDAIVSRLDAALRMSELNDGNAADALDSMYIGIGEGDDLVLLPCRETIVDAGEFGGVANPQGAVFANGDAMFDSICAELDQRPDLTTATYNADWHWTHQFYGLGELVIALFEGTVSTELPSSLSVRVRETDGGDALNYGGNLLTIEGDVVDTGPQWTVNTVDDTVINVINGSTNVFTNPHLVCPIDGATSGSLPNGLLNVSSPADMSAVEMIRWLTHMRDSWSYTHQSLMELTGRGRKVLPKVSQINLKGTSVSLGDAVFSSQIRGTRLPLAPSFNRGRYEQGGHHGCVTWPIVGGMDPVIYPQSNDWGRTDQTVAVDISLRGPPTALDRAPSRITGQMANGRLGNWQASGLPGGRDVTNVVSDLFSMPAMEDGVTLWLQDAMQIAMGANYPWVNGHSTVGDNNDPLAVGTLGVNSQDGTFVRENFHPVIGFMPGYFHVQGDAHSVGALNPTPDYQHISRMDDALTQVIYTSENNAGVTTQTTMRIKGPGNLSNLAATSHSEPWDFYLPDDTLNPGHDWANFPTHSGFHWDPGYSQIVGNSMHRLCGLSTMKAAWLHPFVKGPVSVFASYVPLYDMYGTMDWVDRKGRVTGIGPAGYGDEDELTELGITQKGTYDNYAAGSFETGYAHAVGVIPFNAPELIKSKMIEDVTATMFAEFLTGGYGAVNSLYGDLAVAQTNPIFNLDGWSFCNSLPNSNGRNPLLKFGSYGLNKLDGSGVAAAVPAAGAFAVNSPWASTDYNV